MNGSNGGTNKGNKANKLRSWGISRKAPLYQNKVRKDNKVYRVR